MFYDVYLTRVYQLALIKPMAGIEGSPGGDVQLAIGWLAGVHPIDHRSL